MLLLYPIHTSTKTGVLLKGKKILEVFIAPEFLISFCVEFLKGILYVCINLFRIIRSEQRRI